ncbi:hypothetical protein FACS189429_0390 [Bacteroidia bacterium]|nr:hypothetical protein FACS189429_0390 [Bacteroidia bacterium]
MVNKIKSFNMKTIIIKNVIFLAVLMFGTVAFYSCKDESSVDYSANPKIDKFYLEDAQSSVPDRDLTDYGNFVRIGQTLRLEGSGFMSVTKVLINGVEVPFNPTLRTDNSMIVQVATKVPVKDVDPAYKNKICLLKGSESFCFDIEVRSSNPSITSISHTMPQAGDEITLTGAGLQFAEKVIFPGNPQVEVTSGITSDDEDGKWVKVVVPAGVNKSGSILVECANGGAYSTPDFNFKEGLLHNFDNVQNYQWGSGIDNNPLTAVVPASGACKSQGGYQIFNVSGSSAAKAVEKFWLNSTNVQSIISANIPMGTFANECGIQMDIYVEGEWNSGFIRFVMADGSGDTKYCMLYEPVYVGGKYDKAAFVNTGSWFTVTLPFSASADFEGKTIDDVLAQMASASYQQMGPHFVNDGIADVFEAVPATEKIYFDNIRVVPLTAAPTFSDFPDEE